MNADDPKRIQQLLQQSLPPTGDEGANALHRDLWPSMLRRLDQRATPVPWFDWALLAALFLWLALFPGTIPVLLYHL
jgi:hypothetical protein